MQSTIKRRPLGNTGLNVTEISWGAMNVRRLPDEQAAIQLANEVLDKGVNLIDTARGYESKDENGNVVMASEIILGKAISARTDLDEPIVIVTKGHAYTPEDFDRSLTESWERLQIREEGGKLFIGSTQIFLAYFLHGIMEDRWKTITTSGTLEHAAKRREEGRCHFLGFSSHYGDSVVIKEAIETGIFQLCELSYNVYNPSLGEEGDPDIIKLANEHGMGVVNMKAFNGGGTVAIFKQLEDITGITHGDMARFSLSNPYISCIDAGVRAIEELEVDIEASLLPVMTPDERSALREKAKKISPFLNVICRECLHCVEKFECPQGIDFPHILGMHGRYSVSKSLGLDTTGYKDEYAKFSPDASACVACGNCNEWCEYHLNVPEMMATAAKDFGGA